MTTIVFELFEALKKAGIDEDTARKAAQAVVGAEEKEHLATKADLAELKAEVQAMLNRQLQIMVALTITLTGVFAAIVKL